MIKSPFKQELNRYFKNQLTKKYPDKVLITKISAEYPNPLKGNKEIESLFIYYPHKEKALRLQVEKSLIQNTPELFILKQELQSLTEEALILKYPGILLIPGLKEKLSCTESIGEQLTRLAFNYHFKAPFTKIKPKWLVNPKTRSRLELDGFNLDLKIAFELNGVHHFKRQFTKQSDIRFKDKLKKNVCKKRKIKLYSIHYKNLPQLIKYLHQEFKIPVEWLERELKSLN